jgi:hypothetical protein
LGQLFLSVQSKMSIQQWPEDVCRPVSGARIGYWVWCKLSVLPPRRIGVCLAHDSSGHRQQCTRCCGAYSQS